MNKHKMLYFVFLFSVTLAIWGISTSEVSARTVMKEHYALGGRISSSLGDDGDNYEVQYSFDTTSKKKVDFKITTTNELTVTLYSKSGKEILGGGYYYSLNYFKNEVTDRIEYSFSKTLPKGKYFLSLYSNGEAKYSLKTKSSKSKNGVEYGALGANSYNNKYKLSVNKKKEIKLKLKSDEVIEVSLYKRNGKKIKTYYSKHNGGSGKEIVAFSRKLAKGTYYLRINSTSSAIYNFTVNGKTVLML